MEAIVGNDVSRDRLANFLDGAGGDVQVALEHYFMMLSSIEASAQRQDHHHPQQQLQVNQQPPPPPPPSSTHSQSHGVQMVATMEDTLTMPPCHYHHHRRPLSQLIIPIPSMMMAETAETMTHTKPTATITLSSAHTPQAPATSYPVNDGFTAVINAARESTLPTSSRMRQGSLKSSTLEQLSVTAASTLEDHHQQQQQQQQQQSQETAVEGLTIQDFEMLSVLGKGSFGAVMLVRFKKDGRVFALKIIKKSNMDTSDIKNAMEERQILQRIHHPYICSLVFAFQTNERLYLGMKFYAAGDLFYHLNMRGRMELRHARLYGAELVLAISYLHELNILYRDLKPSNVMIDDEGHIGVVDFGLSKQHIYGSSCGVKTLSGTAEYVAPEALTQGADGSRSYGKAYDWWSLGIVIYEMLAGESPFYHRNEHKMLSKIAYAEVVFPDDFPREALDLVRGLLCKDPARRLGSETMGGVDVIKSNRFFKGIHWEKLLRREVPAYWKPKLTGDTDTRYVDPEFIDEGPPSAVYDPSATAKKSFSKRFSQFSFNSNLQ